MTGHAQSISNLGGKSFAKYSATKLNRMVKKFDQDLHHLELCLSRQKSQYLCGEQICPIDLLIYCEIFAAINILPPDALKLIIYPNLGNWYDRIRTLGCWTEINKEFTNSLAERTKAGGQG